jgi:hypothetical protein
VLLYAGGHLNDYAFVRCEVKCIKIPSNLHDALQTLRNSNHSVVLWADSICVDQHSSLEKNSQVALMGRIYQRASGVTDWLGTNKDGVSSSAFALARQIARHEHPSIPRKSTDINPRRSVLNDLEWYALIEYADASGITTLDAEERSFWTALVDVYRRSWFTKVATDRVRRRMSIMSVASWGENHNKISVSIQIIGRSSQIDASAFLGPYRQQYATVYGHIMVSNQYHYRNPKNTDQLITSGILTNSSSFSRTCFLALARMSSRRTRSSCSFMTTTTCFT